MNEVPNTFPGLFWSYLVVWLLLSLYILYLGRKVSRIERELKATQPDSAK